MSEFDRLYAVAEWIRGQADATQSNGLYSDHLLVHRARARIAELEQLPQVNETYEAALHEIYTKACQAMNSDDDLYLYQFAGEVRDIALAAHTGKSKQDP